MSDQQPRLARFEAQERELVYDAFEHSDAVRLGLLIVQAALDGGLPVTVDIRRSDLTLFHASLDGATTDNEEWVRRKSATALRFESSTALVSERLTAGGTDPFTGGWLDPTDYTLAGGSFPVRVRHVGVVAAVTVSGLTSDEDHEFVVESVRRHLRTTRS